MGLLTPIWMSKNLYRSSDRKLERAIARVSKLEDEELIKAATIAPCPDIRYAALKRLNDQTVLTQVALMDSKEHIRRFAADKITDPILLEKVVTNTGDLSISLRLLYKLPDAALSESELKNLCSNEYETRRDAVERLRNQRMLAEVARKDENLKIRQRAVEKLCDSAALAEVALNEKDGYTRGIATKKLTDQTVLAEIARRDKNEFVRGEAVEKLTDQTVLAEIAHEDKSFDVVLAAIKSLERIKSLEENIDIALVERIIGFLRNGNELDKSRAVLDKSRAVTVLKKIYCDVQSPKEVKRYIRARQGNYKYDSHSDSGCYMHEDHFEPFIHFDVQ